jgi:hypothetical protein
MANVMEQARSSLRQARLAAQGWLKQLYEMIGAERLKGCGAGNTLVLHAFLNAFPLSGPMPP